VGSLGTVVGLGTVTFALLLTGRVLAVFVAGVGAGRLEGAAHRVPDDGPGECAVGPEAQHRDRWALIAAMRTTVNHVATSPCRVCEHHGAGTLAAWPGIATDSTGRSVDSVIPDADSVLAFPLSQRDTSGGPSRMAVASSPGRT